MGLNLVFCDREEFWTYENMVSLRLKTTARIHLNLLAEVFPVQYLFLICLIFFSAKCSFLLGSSLRFARELANSSSDSCCLTSSRNSCSFIDFFFSVAVWLELVSFLPPAAFNRVGRSEHCEGVHKEEGTKVMFILLSPFQILVSTPAVLPLIQTRFADF